MKCVSANIIIFNNLETTKNIYVALYINTVRQVNMYGEKVGIEFSADLLIFFINHF